jgi:hypothetical protein
MQDFLMPPVIDVETSGGTSPATYANRIKKFLDRVESLTGYKPIIYTSRSKWAEVEPRSYWGEYDLWVAHYTTGPEPLVPTAWDEYTFWQYTSRGRGATYGAGSNYIDLNRFNGTEDEFLLYLGAPPPKPQRIRVTNWRNTVLRDTPNGELVAVAMKDEELTVKDVGADNTGREWYQTTSGLWLIASHTEEV